jgi:hypothetical protein
MRGTIPNSPIRLHDVVLSEEQGQIYLTFTFYRDKVTFTLIQFPNRKSCNAIYTKLLLTFPNYSSHIYLIYICITL